MDKNLRKWSFPNLSLGQTDVMMIALIWMGEKLSHSGLRTCLQALIAKSHMGGRGEDKYPQTNNFPQKTLLTVSRG